jgi:flavin reductase (DIM6/NTAB) family NADH-FMN oxidoreductase RutF
MYYESGKHREAGLAFDPFKALVAPRPIGWISSCDAAGRVNLSPYSFFNAFSGRPPIVGFSSEGRKDAIAFIEETREFVCNIVGRAMFEAMSLTSAPLPRGESEFAFAGLEQEPSRLVRPPRVKGAAAAMECRLIEVIALKDLSGAAADRFLAIGQVVAFHIDPAHVRDGIVDITSYQPVARCGYQDYSIVERLVALPRPEGA